MKIDLEIALKENLELKEKLSSSKEKLPYVVSRIEKVQNKGKNGLGFNHKKHLKKKKYVDLPSNKVCSYCGNSGHLVDGCYSRRNKLDKNSVYVKKVWKEKNDSCLSEEPKKDWVPPTDV